MATSTRPITPQAPNKSAPFTPTSLPSAPLSHAPLASIKENSLLSAHAADKSDPRAAVADRASLSPKSSRLGLLPRLSQSPLTGAAAVAEARRQRRQDSRQTSPNPAVSALNALMGGGQGTSRPSDVPATNRLSEPMRKVVEKITVRDSTPVEPAEPSPTNSLSLGVTDNMAPQTSMTATANGTSAGTSFVAEPASMTDAPSQPGVSAPSTGAEEGRDNKAFTYPGPASADTQEGPSRGMSMPGVGVTAASPKSPTAKRHKCPYCSTDFTRHHNLKSHLLTHSQEKPYVCQTCSARFRRLHDLKRHTKLHTGERPHTCPKCGRRFARGDALARHNKGPGGCAGRRLSFGGDGGDDDGGGEDRAGDDNMEGLEYPGEQGEEDREEEEEDMSEQQQRRVSEPSRKRTHLETPQDAGRAVYRQHSSTYPPIAGRMMRGDMGPPSTVMASSSGATSPVSSSNIMSPSAGSSYAGSHFYAPSTGSGVPPPTVFAQGGMTESPKPLSPGQQDAHRLGVTEQPGLRNRSPSLTQQFQQAHFGRGSGRGTPPILQPGQYSSHPPPPTHLPSLPGLGPAATTRPTMQTVPLAPSMLAHQQNASTTSLNQISSNPSSMSSHGGHQQNSSGNSMREVLGPDSQDLWNYIRSLEGRFSRMQDEYELRISRLQEDVISLKGQLNYPPR